MIKAVFLTFLIVLASLYLVQSVNSLSKTGQDKREEDARYRFNYGERLHYGYDNDPYRSSRQLRERLKNYQNRLFDDTNGLLAAQSNGHHGNFKNHEKSDKRMNDRHDWGLEYKELGDGPSLSSLRKATFSANSDRVPINFPMKRVYEQESNDKSTFGDIYFVAIVAGCSTAAIFGVISAGYCFYKFQQHNKAAADVEYPAYGVVGPATSKENVAAAAPTGNVSPTGDRKLAQSAQMYHYHHQKQQMIASEKAATSRHTSASDVDSDEDNEEGEYTVYECPGLAPTGEMEVKNPLFQDDITPVSTPPVTAATTTNCTKDN